jgi:hypothetical protein
MRTKLPILALFALAFVIGCQSSGQNSSASLDSNGSPVKSDTTNPPVAVLIMHVGPERKPIWPLVWYADEPGLRMAVERIPATHRDFAKKEKVTGPLLESLYAQAKPTHSISADRPFGSTELTFLYAGSGPQVFFLKGADLKAACEKLQSEVPKQSYVWDYFVRIGVSKFK